MPGSGGSGASFLHESGWLAGLDLAGKTQTPLAEVIKNGGLETADFLFRGGGEC